MTRGATTTRSFTSDSADNTLTDTRGHPLHLQQRQPLEDGDLAIVPWGTATSITGSESLNTRFPGQWYQLESGLNYNWHRHYDPTIGRYTQPDPLGFVDGSSIYAYAINSPINNVDRDGRNSITQGIVIGGRTGALICGPECATAGAILGAAAGAGILAYECYRKSNKDDCQEQWEADSAMCDQTYRGYRNRACHEWANENRNRCIKGGRRQDWEEVDPGED